MRIAQTRARLFACLTRSPFDSLLPPKSRAAHDISIADNDVRCKCYFKGKAIRTVKDSARSKSNLRWSNLARERKIHSQGEIFISPPCEIQANENTAAKTRFLVSLLLLFLSLSLSPFLALFLSGERESGSGASEPFIIFLVTSHPGKTSWQRNYVCDDSTPVVVPSSLVPPPFLAHNVLPHSTTRLKSSGSSTAANCRTVRQVDGTLAHVTKCTPRVILANNTSTFEPHCDDEPCHIQMSIIKYVSHLVL